MAKTRIKSDDNSFKLLKAVAENPKSTVKRILEIAGIPGGWASAFERMRQCGWLDRHEGRPSTWSITELGLKKIEEAKSNGDRYVHFGKFTLPVLAGHEKSKEAAEAFLKILGEVAQDEDRFELAKSPTWNSMPEELKDLQDGVQQRKKEEAKAEELKQQGLSHYIDFSNIEKYTWFNHFRHFRKYHQEYADDHFGLELNGKLTPKAHELLKAFEIWQAVKA